MAQRLYKYKSASDRNIDALINDSLYITSLDQMNDPLEFGFYVDKKLDLSKIIPFQQWLFQQFCCMSFSTSVTCRRLWNYYTDAMKGMAIEYWDSSVRKALEKREISSVEYTLMVPKRTPKFSNVASEGKVVYDGAKTDLSNWYNSFSTGAGPSQFVSSEALFHKDDSWADEKEYRFTFDMRYLKGDNMLMDLAPSSIYIGYQMEEEKVNRLLMYCKKKNIPLYKYTPDFHSNKSKQYLRDVIYQPIGRAEKQKVIEITE